MLLCTHTLGTCVECFSDAETRAQDGVTGDAIERRAAENGIGKWFADDGGGRAVVLGGCLRCRQVSTDNESTSSKCGMI